MADLNTRISDFVWKNLDERHFQGKKDPFWESLRKTGTEIWLCLLYTSDAADDLLCVDLGGRRIIKKKTR